MPAKKSDGLPELEDIDRQIAALQAKRVKAVERKERDSIEALRGVLKGVAKERRAAFVLRVRKVCEEALAA